MSSGWNRRLPAPDDPTLSVTTQPDAGRLARSWRHAGAKSRSLTPVRDNLLRPLSAGKRATGLPSAALGAGGMTDLRLCARGGRGKPRPYAAQCYAHGLQRSAGSGGMPAAAPVGPG